MNVIFSDTVQRRLENYAQSLSNYPISNERAKEKFENAITRYLHEYLSKRLPLTESTQTVVRMNERELKNMVKHTVKRILNEV
jgi:hypothetical protein